MNNAIYTVKINQFLLKVFILSLDCMQKFDILSEDSIQYKQILLTYSSQISLTKRQKTYKFTIVTSTGDKYFYIQINTHIFICLRLKTWYNYLPLN